MGRTSEKIHWMASISISSDGTVPTTLTRYIDWFSLFLFPGTGGRWRRYVHLSRIHEWWSTVLCYLHRTCGRAGGRSSPMGSCGLVPRISSIKERIYSTFQICMTEKVSRRFNKSCVKCSEYLIGVLWENLTGSLIITTSSVQNPRSVVQTWT